jgi:hypothetical protein
MSDETLFGVPISYDLTEDPTRPPSLKELLNEAVRIVERQFLEIKEIGLEITQIKVMSASAPVRFYVKFPADKPQWETRKALEEKLYDVGQKLGRNELVFYVTKRVEKTKGWAQ